MLRLFFARQAEEQPIKYRSYAVAWFRVTQRVPEATLFACGSMVRAEHS